MKNYLIVGSIIALILMSLLGVEVCESFPGCFPSHPQVHKPKIEIVSSSLPEDVEIKIVSEDIKNDGIVIDGTIIYNTDKIVYGASGEIIGRAFNFEGIMVQEVTAHYYLSDHSDNFELSFDLDPKTIQLIKIIVRQE